MTPTELLLRRLQHLRVIPEKEGDLGSLDIRDLVDGISCTIGYARNQEAADSLNRTFEIAREVLAIPPELRDFKSRISRLAPAPGDVLLIKTDSRLTMAVMDQLKGLLVRFFPDNRAVVLEAGISLDVIPREKLAEFLKDSGVPA